MDKKNKLRLGDVIEISQRLQNDVRGEGKIEKKKYEVLQVFPHFVLCRKIKGGYKECFTWHQMKTAGRLCCGEGTGK